jgi:hypothetical protein
VPELTVATVTGVHSAVKVPVEGPTRVTVVAGGHTQLTVAGPLQPGRVRIVAGVKKANVVGGQVTTEVGGNSVGQVMTAVAGPVMEAVTGKGLPTAAEDCEVPPPPLPPPPPDPHGPERLPHPSGGPLVTSGQGGNVIVLPVDRPSPFVTETIECEMGTLGDGLKAPVAWPSVTTTLDWDSLSVVMGSIIITIVVVVMTKEPPAEDPTSRDVVYGGTEMVVLEASELGGKTKVQGAEHWAVWVVYTSSPR